MKILVTTALDVRDGYGYIGQELSLALSNLGHTVQIEPIQAWFSQDQLKQETRQLIDNKMGAPDFQMVIMYPVYGFKKLKPIRGLLTMYEANSIPTQWVTAINGFVSPIFAPSKFVQQMFQDSGVQQTVYHLKLGIDLDTYEFKPRTFPEGRPFRFLSIGKMEPRKNSTVLLEAFLEKFAGNNDVELIIKTRERFAHPTIVAAAQQHNNVKLIAETLTEFKLVQLMHDCDVFVYPSRGEGFSFPPRNAIATGMPTIVTDWSALSEIPGAIKIPIDGLSPMHPCGFSYGEEKHLLMADVDPHYLAGVMELVYATYDSVAETTAKFRPQICTWESCAIVLTSYIREILDR